jgi:Phage tail protein (Tail_P2_I)
MTAAGDTVRAADATASAAGAKVSAAYRVSGPVPALFHEDPLFLDLSAALDELLSPMVTAVDCFGAYLDPWLAPGDFLGWLGSLVGVRGQPGSDGWPAGGGDARAPGPRDAAGEPRERQQRALIAGAVRAYRARGTAGGLRAVVAAATCVPAAQIGVAESGAVVWSDTPGAAAAPPFDPVVTITVAVPPGRDRALVAACARAAAELALPVFSQLRIEVVES